MCLVVVLSSPIAVGLCPNFGQALCAKLKTATDNQKYKLFNSKMLVYFILCNDHTCVISASIPLDLIYESSTPIAQPILSTIDSFFIGKDEEKECLL